MADENSTPTPQDAQTPEDGSSASPVDAGTTGDAAAQAPDTNISAAPIDTGVSDDIPTAQVVPAQAASDEGATQPQTEAPAPSPADAAPSATGQTPAPNPAAQAAYDTTPQNDAGQGAYGAGQQSQYGAGQQQGYAAPQKTTVVSSGKDHIVAGVLAILLGSLGIHKFYLGYNTEGIIMLLISLVLGCITAGVATIVMEIIALVEGIIYLVKPQQEFDNIYVYNKKGWF